ncbi:fused phosphoenolpyruvate-protein phosphotransferase PtsP/GAF domain [Legionella beliardensis]|uniref:Fused phosphoenolpyruvate-protein phosphotransferase PtsP/GAF domain n=1 Tax=Legionella beliardensis TaxID=91822 RepID=A0A378I675_9GAMM|nr:GAF domain-containing protein [Legionella beliardensis]STX27974.1 fused phosphoenolpyruvate-protein phosphotransferase PtsP/GAF domain [Legionella beliardensis]
MASLNTLLAKILTKFSADVGTIHQLNEQERCLYLVAYTKGLPDNLIAASKRIPVEKESVVGVTYRHKKPVVVSNLSSSDAPIIKPMEKEVGVGGMISAPIFHEQKVIGTIGIGCFIEREFTEKEAQELMRECEQSLALLLLNTNP